VGQRGAQWDERRIGVALALGALIAMLIASAAPARYGALAAAAGSLVGTLIVNAQAIRMALSDRGDSDTRAIGMPASHNQDRRWPAPAALPEPPG
jgi:uncharacterized membrane protein YebE (DUF533 family)